jgi:hypothetical protein
MIWAFLHRPSRKSAAVAIDEKLGLKEKFSTALYVRPSSDPFAMAAVKDAETTADNVSLYKAFPLPFPRATYGFLIVAFGAFLTAWLMRPLDLFGHQQIQKKQLAEQRAADDARKNIEKALATVNSMPKAVADDEAIQLAKQDLKALLEQPIKDPAKANRTALKTLQDVNDAIKAKIQDNQKFADAANDAKMFKSLQPPSNETGPVADAQRALAKGDFSKAIDDIDSAVKNFEKMDKKEQGKAAEQMKQLANQLQQMANDPAKKKELEQKLQQMGANQQQAQQMAQQMQQAAAGDKQAQQQLQQMQQQLMQQMNNGQGPNQQQQQQIQQMMQQMQAQANAQQQAQQMANAAQQMAQGMQQAAQGKQQQANGQQQQNGQQQGQQGNGQKQMAQGQQQMQQQLQQMQAIQQDAQQIAAAQQQGQQAQQDAANACNGGQPGGQNGDPNQQGQGGQGQWQNGDPNQWQQANPNGPGGLGRGAGDRSFKQNAPYAVKQEVAPSQDDEKGKILASTFVKAKSIKGESKAELRQVAQTAEQQQTDEVDQEGVSRPAQKVVREYFGSMEKDAGKE